MPMKPTSERPERSRRWTLCLGAVACAVATAPASAFFYGVRFVERVGTTDTVLGDSVTFDAGTSHRIRIQFGVFDDAAGPAPVGGYTGWNVGTFDANFGSWRRTPGRLSPFTFAPFPYSNGVPIQDPFTELEQIDNTLGPQLLEWRCGPNGEPDTPPPPVVRGLNEYVSTFETTVDIPAGVEGLFHVTIGGNLLGMREWHFDPELSTPPDCETGTPGIAHYGPLVTPVHPFTKELQVNVVIPAPGAAALALAGFAASARRRRRAVS
jgi:hypothetical protein